jgi:hypothetical protein
MCDDAEGWLMPRNGNGKAHVAKGKQVFIHLQALSESIQRLLDQDKKLADRREQKKLRSGRAAAHA